MMQDDRPLADPGDSPDADWSVAASGKSPGGLRRAVRSWPFKAALSLGLVLFLGATLDWTGVMNTLRAADRALVTAAFAALALVPLLAAERWRCASLASGVPLSRRFFVSATYASLFAAQLLPSGIGMDAVRLGLMWRQKMPLRGSFQSIAIDRMCGVSALLILMYVGLPFALDLLPPAAAMPIAAMTALMAAGCAALLFVDRLPLPLALRRGWFGRLVSLISDTRAAIGTPQAAVALLFGFAIHLVAIYAVLLFAHAFGYGLRYRDLLTVTAVAIFAGMLPVSFNGWGVREGAMMLGLSLLAVPRDVALMISFLYGVGGSFWSLPGSVSWLHLRHPPNPESPQKRAGGNAEI